MSDEKPHQAVKWFTTRELAGLLGMSIDHLGVLRNKRLGPRYKKLGPNPQSAVVYSEPDVAEWQARQLTIDTTYPDYGPAKTGEED